MGSPTGKLWPGQGANGPLSGSCEFPGAQTIAGGSQLPAHIPISFSSFTFSQSPSLSNEKTLTHTNTVRTLNIAAISETPKFSNVPFPAFRQWHPVFFWKETQVGLINKYNHYLTSELGFEINLQ